MIYTVVMMQSIISGFTTISPESHVREEVVPRSRNGMRDFINQSKTNGCTFYNVYIYFLNCIVFLQAQILTESVGRCTCRPT